MTTLVLSHDTPTMPTPAHPRSAWSLSERALACLLLAPAFVLLALVVIYPVGRLVYASLLDLRLSGGSDAHFVGLQNYADLLNDADVRHAALNTLGYVVITVPGALLVGLALALVANLAWRIKWPVRLALLLPWALPMSFSGLIFAWFFHTDFGVVNDLLCRFGVAPISFLLSPTWAFVAVCLASIWKASSFVALIVLAGLQTIPAELYQAARLDGAGRWAQFRHITLPLLAPSLAVAAIFRTLAALQTFDIPYAMTQGGPARATETIAMLIQTNAIDYLDVGYASALAVMLFGVSLLVSLLHLRRVYREANA